MLGPNIPISLNFLLFPLSSINSYYSLVLTFYTSSHLPFFYKLEIIQHKYKTKFMRKSTFGLLSLYYLDILIHLLNGQHEGCACYKKCQSQPCNYFMEFQNTSTPLHMY